MYAQKLEDHASELAEHYAQSVDPEDLTKAIFYGELAAKRAASVFAHGEAVRHLEQALHAQEVLDASDASRQCDLILALGDSLLALGEFHHIVDKVAPRGLTLAGQLADDEELLLPAIWL